ncbi:CRISPR-associated helicase/endonuclease Cas3 [Bacillus sp. FJAT-27264]|uniref:CRISPR-associated helicase/endonuclease Cas3 n=1 Tax=Paenibacillus sp. (strain DSM 101736 / FJAT-27264) TaxID=1850362 RepID=UPI000807F8B7|nr:CRISPR-associated helicase/endonuclease Cas3 [Bacillus sp. FJAT-27264]OBZ15728.1 CRISPR-associated helicase/endonuclease Cas3 [Bacillus sp. FJAT-27264]
MEEYIAHIRESDKKIQTVAEHLTGVKALAEEFGDKLGVKHIAGLAGVLHDMGKYTEEFKEYILMAVYHPEMPPKRGSVDHSTAGGKLLFKLFHDHTKNSSDKVDTMNRMILAEIVGNAIISHHSYLQDFLNPDLESNYLRRVKEKNLEEFEWSETNFFKQVMDETKFHEYVDQAVKELNSYLQKDAGTSREQQLMFLTKFIFSALIDADRTNTRRFEENKVDEPVNHEELFGVFYERLMTKIDSFAEQEGSDSPINCLRREMSDQCDEFAAKASGIYTLSIPTGGGKTLASLRYALKHAKTFEKKHIIYVVPYTTIIEQNAKEVRNILQDEDHILEHHSNVVEEEKEDDELEDGLINMRQKLKLAKDNWDSPIIFTTMVQFLNVFYADGSRNIRRLHNLSESVIIFDEVQKVPVSCISLFNQAVNFLKTHARSSIVLCTATQPELDYVQHKLNIEPEAEMIGGLDHVIQAFKRVDIVDRATGEQFDSDKLADFVMEKVEEVQSVLVILNTKTVVKALYQKLQEQSLPVSVYHLSTSMCAAHRNEILAEVKEKLKDRSPVICISTQLIEAGVDVSFKCVIRSLAGLDSIAQAAGRCNRHGEDDVQQVYVIDHAEEKLDRLKEIKRGKEISAKILVDLKRDPSSHGGSLLSVQAMERYFQEFYTEFESSLNYFIPKLGEDMTDLLSSPRMENKYYQAYRQRHQEALPLFLVNSYKTAAEHFEVIDSHTTSVIVPFREGEEIITELNGQQSIEDLSRLLRNAQQYTINIFTHEKEKLSKNNALVAYLDGKVLALTEGAYHENYGLNLENDSPFELRMW